MRKIVLIALLALGLASLGLARPAPAISIDLAGNGSINVSNWTYGGDFTAHFCDSATISYPDGPNLSVLFVTNYSVSDGSAEYLDADVSGTSLTKSYDPTKGRLTISGVDSVAHYQQVLRTVYYVDTKTNPTSGNRDIEVAAFYGNTGSNAATCTLSVRHDPNAPKKPGTPTPVYTAITSNPTKDQLSLSLRPAQTLTPPYVDLSGGSGGPNYSTWTYSTSQYWAHICPNAIVSYAGTLTSATITLTNRPDGSSEYLAVQNFSLSGLSTSGYNPGTGQLTVTGSMNSAICQALLRSIIYVDLKTIPNTSDRKISLKVTAPTLSSNMPTVTMGVAPPAGNGLLAFAREQAPKPPPQGGPPAVQPRILHFGLEVDDVNLMLDFIQALENKGYNTAADLFSFYLGRKGKTQDDVDLYLDRDYQANEVRIHARNMVRKLIIDECSKRNLGFYKAGTFDLSISSGGTFNPWPRKVRFYPSDDIGQIMTPSNDNPIRWYSIDDNMFYAFGGCNFTLEGHVTVTPFIHRVRNRSYADAIISCPDLVVKINDSFRFFGGSVLDSDTTLSFAVQDAASVLSYRAVVLKAGIFLERRFGYAGFLNHIGYEDPLTFNLSDYWIGSR